ncbi:hypothetical protein NM688_g8643 [Phlebia brevispora]|uniref:Uncharacterized protein n=1 Tax=Phlebia brevispora TaxID=194682 RepID=A0ACC1RPQ9_9APHY|nr:hypothetical protein NM688_g8643 [Phlebia brevispora]
MPLVTHLLLAIHLIGAAIAALARTEIIIPLYGRPGLFGCNGWLPLTEQLQSNSGNDQLQFYIIVNPFSQGGPGDAGTQPAEEYQECLPTLRNLSSHITLLGYVETEWGTRSQTDIATDLATYAGWDESYIPDGIFYDHVNASSDFVTLYSTLAEDAQESFSGGDGYVVLNPGVAPDTPAFYSFADQIVTAEGYYANFSASQLVIDANNPADQQAVILHDAPGSPPTGIMEQLISVDQIGSIYITDYSAANGSNPYIELPGDFAAFVVGVQYYWNYIGPIRTKHERKDYRTLSYAAGLRNSGISLYTCRKVHVLAHPIINERLSKLRQSGTSSKEFREDIHNISLLLGFEASRDLEEETFDGPKIGLTPVLRAGLGMTDAMLTLFPSAPVYHLGIFREKVSLQPVEYYSKLPPVPTVETVFLLDPLIATGGTACAAMHMILDWGIPVTRIKLLCILASEDGLKRVEEEFPGLEVWAAAVDPQLTKDGLIAPGLGDTGDRLYNTLRSD